LRYSVSALGAHALRRRLKKLQKRPDVHHHDECKVTTTKTTQAHTSTSQTNITTVVRRMHDLESSAPSD
jgi:hypothetical protein